jgi:hypothetical protein
VDSKGLETIRELDWREFGEVKDLLHLNDIIEATEILQSRLQYVVD